LVLLAASIISACSRASSNTLAVEKASVVRLSKTVFTEKLGAYMVYSPFKAGKPSDFALHLTDLDEGTPVAKADVTRNLRSKSNHAATTFKAQASETTGVYAAQVAAPKVGEYYVELQISHPKFSGRLTMTDFEVE
jgi:glutamate synthase domain-containing protein 1